MRLLLDTHVVLWQLAGTRTVGPRARDAIERSSELNLSVISFAEIGIKAAIGKLTVPDDLYEHVMRSGVRILGLDPDHGLAAADLPMHHRDPFDRLLVAQARAAGLTLVSADARLGLYDVEVVDAAA